MPRRKKRAPEVVNVCGREIVVTYHTSMPGAFATDDGNFLVEDLEINIDLSANRSPDQILFHELIHAVLAYTGHSDALDASQEEAIVSALEQNLFPHINLKKRK